MAQGTPPASVLLSLTLRQAGVNVARNTLNSIFYGVFLVLALHYFVLAGGRKGDRLALQAFVACLVVLGAAAVIVDASYLGIYQSKAILAGGMLNPRDRPVAGIVRIWLLLAYNQLCLNFWIWRIFKVSQSPLARIPPVILIIGAVAAFVGSNVKGVQQYRGKAVELDDILNWIMAGMWLTASYIFWCGGVLVYVLVWKRRDRVVTSPAIARFTLLALQTSLFTCFCALIGTVGVTYGFITDNVIGYDIFDVMCSLIGPASGICICTSLIQRDKFRHSRGSSGPHSVVLRDTVHPGAEPSRSRVLSRSRAGDKLDDGDDPALWRSDISGGSGVGGPAFAARRRGTETSLRGNDDGLGGAGREDWRSISLPPLAGALAPEREGTERDPGAVTITVLVEHEVEAGVVDSEEPSASTDSLKT